MKICWQRFTKRNKGSVLEILWWYKVFSNQRAMNALKYNHIYVQFLWAFHIVFFLNRTLLIKSYI